MVKLNDYTMFYPYVDNLVYCGLINNFYNYCLTANLSTLFILERSLQGQCIIKLIIL